MTTLEKCNAGIEYSYADEELIALNGRFADLVERQRLDV